MAKSMKPWVKVFDAIEASGTSTTIDCRGCSDLAVHVVLSGAQNWTFSILGQMEADPDGGLGIPVLVDGTALSKQTNASGLLIFKSVPDYVQLKAVEDVNGVTATVYVSPCNV